MYACVCFSVTEEEIHDEVAKGARTEEELGARCGAGTSCGSCVSRLGCLIETALRDPAVAAAMDACAVPCAPALRRHGGIPAPATAPGSAPGSAPTSAPAQPADGVTRSAALVA